MTAKSKKTFYVLLLVALGIFGYCFWLPLRPIDIVAVHHREYGFSSILVRNFPFTDKDKIGWWLKNKDMLKGKYDIPKPEKDGSFTITFWLFGEGYKENDGYDRLCFNDIPPPLNCIDKDAVFSVSNSKNLGTIFTTYDGKYQLQKNGDIVKFTDEFEFK
ncbi:DUF943 family protein [Kosakonia oryziphila]|uniref:Putative membrane protein n=1 Tax=Kosakonia oryziphila TaxID=1005667 RepID=A0A1C4GKM2_9ENTR|nr:DUF943 family protein [Kosakonia oryziphila]SCC68433.1 putative membrane protein [Kosakonia oryziphila]